MLAGLISVVVDRMTLSTFNLAWVQIPTGQFLHKWA